LAERQTIIYPGSFDPPTNGHLDLISRASKLFDDVIVAVLRHDSKHALFDVAERMEMLAETVHGFPNVTIDSFDGLLVDFARRKKAKMILRGIRAVSDYEYELQMALMNRKLDPELETVFMLPAEAYSYLSSRLVKEVCRLGGNISALVPPLVEARLTTKRAKLENPGGPAPPL
jgi:pantetheine-phosphate adenylyltransferase